jgi:mannose-6-phosphate isomerase-like protein (cupin superfamily)
MDDARAVSRETADHYLWGHVSHGWRLEDEPTLSVVEEEVPPGAGETWHVHRVARQFFYVLDGEAVLCSDAGDVRLVAGEGTSVLPGTTHRFTNQSDGPVRFLVISAPSTHPDRYPAEPPARRP